MQSRFFAAVAVLTAGLVGCITFSVTKEANYDVGFKDRFDKAAKEILARSAKAEDAALKGHRALVDPRVKEFVQRHLVKADELVMAHMSRLKDAMADSSPWSVLISFLDEYAEKRSAVLDLTMKLTPSLDIVEAKFPNATAFPNGKIILTRPLAEAFDPDKDGFDDVLLGILIHELMHVRDGHALEQWATADSRQAWARDKLLGAASSMTALIPFLSIKYNIQYPITFGATKQLPTLSEYAADLGAVSLLSNAGRDSERYIAFLSEMSSNMTADVLKDVQRLLRERVECLQAFSNSRFEKWELRGIIIGSKEAGDSTFQTLNLEGLYQNGLHLDSPGLLAKTFPGKPGMSDAERLSEVRKYAYTGCAIRHALSDVALKDGVLVTPIFDLNMFTQHF